MTNENKEESKKGFPGSFLLFLLTIVLLVTLVQNFLSTRTAKVSFSYQLEHLLNLGLIQPDESRKVALNDKLVTFSGKFRDAKTDTGKQRYKYISLLNQNQEFKSKLQELTTELDQLRPKITEAADLYLHLGSVAVPSNGYWVVDNLYDSPDRQNSVVIKKLSEKNIEGVDKAQKSAEDIHRSFSEEKMNRLNRSLTALLQHFRSPILGIGNEATKKQLKNFAEQVDKANEQPQTMETLSIYEGIIDELNKIVLSLNQEDDHIRLNALRSVRDYKDAMTERELILTELDDNTLQLDKARSDVSQVIWYFNNEELSTRALEEQDPEKFHQWFLKAKDEWENFEVNRTAFFRAPDQPLNIVLEKAFRSEDPQPNYLSYLFTILPVLLVVLVLYFVFARQMKGMGSNAMNFGKSPARMLQQGETRFTFKDVAGAEEALEELCEIVDFLKSPNKFTTLGGRIPKGVLLIGPPGTGKTLIAKAVAGEANRPFFSISGSDFVEMFVGVGASRIRDLFDQAKKHAPCIVFIDEIDAVGRHRGAGIGGGHDEREQTLNQLLVEMDGFDSNEGVILMAATNRPDVLDRALLRPGRFDRRVHLELPDIKGRFEILKVHSRKIKMDPSVDLFSIARGTPGASGADLGNLLNEAALMAARKGRMAVTNEEIVFARDKVLYGKERRSMEIDQNEKRTTAYHESGHAVVGLVVERGDPVDKVTIIPRGASLGATHFLPEKNKLSYWKTELEDRLSVLMGGRAAEELFLNDFSSGAQQDIQQATHIARSMVCQWGMSDTIGLISHDERSESGQYLGMQGYKERVYSDETAKAIDHEVRRIVDSAYERAKKILKDYMNEVELMTQMLMEFETLDREDCLMIVVNKNWDIEQKRERLKKTTEAYKKSSVSEEGKNDERQTRLQPPISKNPKASLS